MLLAHTVRIASSTSSSNGSLRRLPRVLTMLCARSITAPSPSSSSSERRYASASSSTSPDLYTPEYSPLPTPHLDYRSFRDKQDEHRLNIQARKAPNADIDRTVQLYEQHTRLHTELDRLRRQRKTNQQAASLNKEAAINLGKELRARIAALETEVDGVAAEMLKAGLAIPNTCHASVPIGPEESSKVLRVVHGHVPVPSHYITDTAAPPPPPHPTATADAAATTSTSTSWRSHVEIAEQHDLVNFQQVRPQLQRYIERERSRSMR